MLEKTKKQIKKSVALAIAFASILSFWNVADAATTASVSYDAQNTKITVTVTTDKKVSTATVAVKKDGRYYILDEFKRTSKDVFSYEGNLPTDCPSGNYTVEVTVGGEKDASQSFFHINELMAQTALTNVNAATSETFASVIQTWYNELAVDLSAFNTHSTLLTKLYFKYKPTGSFDAAGFSTYYNKCLLLCEATQKSDTEIEGFLETNAAAIGFDYDTFDE